MQTMTSAIGRGPPPGRVDQVLGGVRRRPIRRPLATDHDDRDGERWTMNDSAAAVWCMVSVRGR
jgi:hypothetical protein